MLLPGSLAIGRLASQQCLASCRSFLPLNLRRVATLYNLSLSVSRQYATKPVSRPKAHTGRTTSTRKPRAAPKSVKPKATSTAKPKAKTATKATKAKPKAKTRAKRKAKPKVKAKKGKKVLTEKQKLAQADRKKKDAVKALKEKALQVPKPLSATAYQVLFGEQMRALKGNGVAPGGNAKGISEQYKSLSTEQREVS